MKVNLNRASQLSALNDKLVTQCGTKSMSVRYGNCESSRRDVSRVTLPTIHTISLH